MHTDGLRHSVRYILDQDIIRLARCMYGKRACLMCIQRSLSNIVHTTTTLRSIPSSRLRSDSVRLPHLAGEGRYVEEEVIQDDRLFLALLCFDLHDEDG